MTPDERLERYADLAVRVGRTSSGRTVLIALVEHKDIARRCARRVPGRRSASSRSTRSALSPCRRRARPGGVAGLVAAAHGRVGQELGRDAPGVIQLTGNPDASLFEGLDPALVAKSDPREIRAAYLPLVAGRKMNWVIVSAPTEGWANEVFGGAGRRAPVGAVATATRLDEPDPLAPGKSMRRSSRRGAMRSTSAASTRSASAALAPT